MNAVIEKSEMEELIKGLVCQDTEAELGIPLGVDLSLELVEEIKKRGE